MDKNAFCFWGITMYFLEVADHSICHNYGLKNNKCESEILTIGFSDELQGFDYQTVILGTLSCSNVSTENSANSNLHVLPHGGAIPGEVYP